MRSKAMRFAGLAVLAAVLVGGGFLLGRATEDDGSTTEAVSETAADVTPGYNPRKSTADYDAADVVKVFSPVIVRDGEILAEKKGTPERALLEWWQAYQFSDLTAVEALTSKATTDAIGADQLAALVHLPGPGLQGIEILGASEDGDSASIEAGLLNFQPEESGAPPPRKPTSSTPETVAMQKERGDWLFADTEFLSLKLTSLEG